MHEFNHALTNDGTSRARERNNRNNHSAIMWHCSLALMLWMHTLPHPRASLPSRISQLTASNRQSPHILVLGTQWVPTCCSHCTCLSQPLPLHFEAASPEVKTVGATRCCQQEKTSICSASPAPSWLPNGKPLHMASKFAAMHLVDYDTLRSRRRYTTQPEKKCGTISWHSGKCAIRLNQTGVSCIYACPCRLWEARLTAKTSSPSALRKPPTIPSIATLVEDDDLAGATGIKYQMASTERCISNAQAILNLPNNVTVTKTSLFIGIADPNSDCEV